ncbi:hypothetical protein BSK48_16945 [Paenibacillus odorifer]|nr:hypothetical protein BSK48_16945 [Paenibacillus odorifer]
MKTLEKQEALLILLQIKTAYPNFNLDNDTKNLWTQFLMETDAETAAHNLRDHIKQSKFQPTIHEIVKPNEEVIFKRRKQLAIQQEKENEDRMRLAVPPPWKTLGITKSEYEDQIIAEMALGKGNE